MPKWGKKLAGPGQNFVFRFRRGQARAKISISLSGRDGLGSKFQFLFRTEPGPDLNFFFFTSGRAGPRAKMKWDIGESSRIPEYFPPLSFRKLQKMEPFFQLVHLWCCYHIDHLRRLHYAYIARKNALVKLFSQNQQNSITALRKFCRIEQIRRGPISSYALCKMMQKFDATGHLAFSQVEEGIKSRLPALKMSLLLL